MHASVASIVTDLEAAAAAAAAAAATRRTSDRNGEHIFFFVMHSVEREKAIKNRICLPAPTYLRRRRRRRRRLLSETAKRAL